MDDSVASNFSTAFKVKTVIFTLFVLGSTYICGAIAISGYDSYTWGQLTAVGVYSLILLYIYAYVLITATIVITATREGIVIDYLITKRQVIIDYADIVHVSNIRVNDLWNIA